MVITIEPMINIGKAGVSLILTTTGPFTPQTARIRRNGNTPSSSPKPAMKF